MATYLSVHIITGLDEKTLPLDEPNEVIALSQVEVQLFHIPTNNKHMCGIHILEGKASFCYRLLTTIAKITLNYSFIYPDPASTCCIVSTK